MTRTFSFLSKSALAAALAIGLPGASQANDRDQVFISGYVPVQCSVALNGSPVPMGHDTYVLGTMDSTCNARRGYRIMAYGGPSFAGAIMDVSGRTVTFDASGSAVLVDMPEGGTHSQSLVLLTQGHEPASLSLAIEAN